MGQSTDAIIAWGIQFGEGEEMPWAKLAEDAGYDEPESDDALAFLLCGIAAPTTEYEDDRDAHRLHWKLKREALEQCPVELISHCYGDEPMYMLGISASEKKAHRGSPVELATDTLHVYDFWPEEFAKYCALLGIEDPQPKWWLFSDWC